MGTTHQSAESLLAPGRGILVADEYVDRLIASLRSGDAEVGEGANEQYAEVALGAAGLNSYISGVLLPYHSFMSSEPARKEYRRGDQAIQFGVRMDASGTSDPTSETRTPGYGDVRRRLVENREAGASFAEWRANLHPLSVAPAEAHIDAAALALGAAVSQAEDVLPMVTVAMPDLASHSVSVTQAVTANALSQLFGEMTRLDVDLSALVLRINMMLSGDASRVQTAPDDVARATLRVVSETVPPEVAGIGFLSGGQPIDRACANLAAITALARSESMAWPLTFAFTRALLRSSINAWRCDSKNIADAQRDLIENCRAASQAVSSGAGSPPPARSDPA